MLGWSPSCFRADKLSSQFILKLIWFKVSTATVAFTCSNTSGLLREVTQVDCLVLRQLCWLGWASQVVKVFDNDWQWASTLTTLQLLQGQNRTKKHNKMFPMGPPNKYLPALTSVWLDWNNCSSKRSDKLMKPNTYSYKREVSIQPVSSYLDYWIIPNCVINSLLIDIMR